MKVRSISGYYLLTIALVAVAVFVCLDVFEANAVGELIPFIVSVISLIIAVLAFDISMKTYTSIDAVNSISRMDGNIMENPDYRTNIIAILRHLTFADKKQTRDSVMQTLNSFFSDDVVVSGAKLADSIQKLIDYMILLPYFVNSNDAQYAKESKKKIDKLIKIIEKEISQYDRMSEGSSVLLEENLKLIKAVFAVQLKRTDSVLNPEVALMEVRGTMLKNPVSKTLYYDYSGLFYLVKALDLIGTKSGFTDHRELYKIDNIRKIGTLFSPVEKELVLTYLQNADDEFNKALEVIDGDLMWSGMIYFNKARVKFFMCVVSAGAKCSDWKSVMNKAIYYRNRFNVFLSGVLPESDGAYLIRAFADEEKYALMLKTVFEMAEYSDVTNADGGVEVHKNSYADVKNLDYVASFTANPQDSFNMLTASYNEIVTHS